jgi:hypothetical protein
MVEAKRVRLQADRHAACVIPSIRSLSKGKAMLGTAAPYLMAFSAMLLAGLSALTLFRAVRHFDPQEPAPTQKPHDGHVAA